MINITLGLHLFVLVWSVGRHFKAIYTLEVECFWVNTEETQIPNGNTFFHYPLIRRPESLQPGQKHTYSVRWPARWRGPKYYMLAQCRKLQLNCTANSSVNYRWVLFKNKQTISLAHSFAFWNKDALNLCLENKRSFSYLISAAAIQPNNRSSTRNNGVPHFFKFKCPWRLDKRPAQPLAETICAYSYWVVQGIVKKKKGFCAPDSTYPQTKELWPQMWCQAGDSSTMGRVNTEPAAREDIYRGRTHQDAAVLNTIFVCTCVCVRMCTDEWLAWIEFC